MRTHISILKLLISGVMAVGNIAGPDRKAANQIARVSQKWLGSRTIKNSKPVRSQIKPYWFARVVCFVM